MFVSYYIVSPKLNSASLHLITKADKNTNDLWLNSGSPVKRKENITYKCVVNVRPWTLFTLECTLVLSAPKRFVNYLLKNLIKSNKIPAGEQDVQGRYFSGVFSLRDEPWGWRESSLRCRAGRWAGREAPGRPLRSPRCWSDLYGALSRAETASTSAPKRMLAPGHTDRPP